MRIPIAHLALLLPALPGLLAAATPDLPYIEGTPFADDPRWQLVSYEGDEAAVRWARLEKDRSTAYIVYPAQQTTLLPDNTAIPASEDRLTLRITGDGAEDHVFTRFGAMFSLSGPEIEVRYTVGEGAGAADAEAAYVGDISVEAEQIAIDLIAQIDGDLELVAHDTLSVYGLVNLGDYHLSAYANGNLIIGKIISAGGELHVCSTDFDDLPPNINIGTPYGHKVCSGDVAVQQAQAESQPTKTYATTNVASSKSGQTTGFMLVLLGLLAVFRKRVLH
jgi:hypothetical protein